MVKTISWKIEGMRCGACARTIEARLIRVPGMRQAEVSFPAGSARILLNPHVADLGPMIGLLQQAGYRVEQQGA